MTAAFLRGFIPNSTTRSKLLKPIRPGSIGNTASLQEIIENSSFVNQNLPCAKRKKPVETMQPERVIEKFSKIVEDTRFKNRELLLTEKDTRQEQCAEVEAMTKAIAKTLAGVAKSNQPIQEDYRLLRDSCSEEEQLKTYFNSIISELDKIIKSCADQYSSVYQRIRQEIENLKEAAEAETDKSGLRIYSKPYWEERASSQAMQDFLSAECQRLNSKPYKNTNTLISPDDS